MEYWWHHRAHALEAGEPRLQESHTHHTNTRNDTKERGAPSVAQRSLIVGGRAAASPTKGPVNGLGPDTPKQTAPNAGRIIGRSRHSIIGSDAAPGCACIASCEKSTPTTQEGG